VIEYLIVHELCHILHPHHQNEFWECVEKYLPNWKALDRELLKSSLPYLDNINNHN
jgi:predicted metal-dependent hydrolase